MLLTLLYVIQIGAKPVILKSKALTQHGGMRLPALTSICADYDDGNLNYRCKKDVLETS